MLFVFVIAKINCLVVDLFHALGCPFHKYYCGMALVAPMCPRSGIEFQVCAFYNFFAPNSIGSMNVFSSEKCSLYEVRLYSS